jgi:hypothetical protein
MPDEPSGYEAPDPERFNAETYPECPTCELIRTKHGGCGPSHNGSPRCESGSIASGGTRAHCTCSRCF